MASGDPVGGLWFVTMQRLRPKWPQLAPMVPILVAKVVQKVHLKSTNFLGALLAQPVGLLGPSWVDFSGPFGSICPYPLKVPLIMARV